MFTVLDRNKKLVLKTDLREDTSFVEEILLLEEDGDGRWQEYPSRWQENSKDITRGEERAYIWLTSDGRNIEVGTLIYE